MLYRIVFPDEFVSARKKVESEKIWSFRAMVAWNRKGTVRGKRSYLVVSESVVWRRETVRLEK